MFWVDKDWLFAADEYICDLRTAAVLVKDQKKDNCDVVIGWMPIEEIQRVTIYPEFIKDEIHHLDGPMKHFVSKG